MTTPTCKTHPDAPHGFSRNGSHNAHRYVCECESWSPEESTIAKDRTDMTTLPPLKPCPLCGGPVVMVDHPDHLAANGSWSIYCYRCNLDLSQPYIGVGYPGDDKEKMRKLAIKDWNRRAK